MTQVRINVTVINEVICKAKAHNSTDPEQPFIQKNRAALGGIQTHYNTFCFLRMSALPTELPG